VLLLGRNFFVLSSNFKKNQLDEIYLLVKHANFSYRDVVRMPIFERRYFVEKLIDEFNKR
jgi:hypothetical protein